MFCLLGSDTEQHFDAATQMSYRAHQGWTASYEKSIPITSFRLRGYPVAMPLGGGVWAILLDFKDRRMSLPLTFIRANKMADGTYRTRFGTGVFCRRDFDFVWLSCTNSIAWQYQNAKLGMRRS